VRHVAPYIGPCQMPDPVVPPPERSRSASLPAGDRNQESVKVPKDDDSRRFYERFGFTASPSVLLDLFVLIKKATADSGRKEQGRGSEHPPSSVFVPLREEADRVLWASHACG
jgi:hypothetical protein